MTGAAFLALGLLGASLAAGDDGGDPSGLGLGPHATSLRLDFAEALRSLNEQATPDVRGKAADDVARDPSIDRLMISSNDAPTRDATHEAHWFGSSQRFGAGSEERAFDVSGDVLARLINARARPNTYSVSPLAADPRCRPRRASG